MRSKTAIKTSVINMFALLLTMTISFVTRRLFIHYLGIDLLGVNSVVTTTLQMLALAELGVQTAIVFSLYNPLSESNQNEISRIVTLLKEVYFKIGFVILGLGFILMLFLPLIIKDVPIDMNLIRITYVIQLLTTVSSYFLAYKRALFYADQKQYISTVTDTIINITFGILKILLLVFWPNYIMYVALAMFQVVTSNLIVSLLCKKHYPWLSTTHYSTKDQKKFLYKNTGDIFAGKIAGYIYASTDNLILSIVRGTRLVGFLSNYQFVMIALNTLISTLVTPVQPIIGNYLTEVKNKQETESLLYKYTFIRYFLISMIIVPTFAIIQKFISLWAGESYLLSQLIVMLLMADIYISIVHGPTGEFINGLGFFRYEKYVSALGATMNVLTSIVGAIFWGIEGVLLGTVVSQLIMWAGRSFIVYKYYFKETGMLYWKYWFKIIQLTLTLILETALAFYCVSWLLPQSTWINFILGGSLSVLIAFLGTLVFYGRSSEMGYLVIILKQIILRKKVS